MMDVPLTLDLMVDRAERWNGDVEVVSRRPDKSLHRTTYREVMQRARRLARALVGAGIKRGDRVATLMWNHASHLEVYFGVPLSGGVLHTLNLRLHPDEVFDGLRRTQRRTLEQQLTLEQRAVEGAVVEPHGRTVQV